MQAERAVFSGAPVKQLLLVGAGGHCKVAIDVARAAGVSPVGVIASQACSEAVLGVPIVGTDNDADQLRAKGFRDVFIAIGDNAIRRRVARDYLARGFQLATLMHPSAIISPSASIGAGVLVMPQAVINADAHVGDLAIVNTGAIIEHDCIVGEASHVAPRSVMGGNVTLGEEVFFGIGAVARPRATIGARAIIGAAAAVVGDIPADCVAAGVPARLIRRSDPPPARE